MVTLLLSSIGLAALPLKQTSYDVVASGPYVDVSIEQVFVNDSDDWLEATYVFPLHELGAVDAMSMIIGNLEIKGEIHEREEAAAIYEEAVNRGQAAALTEQERDNVFTQRVGNIPPHEEIVVRMHVVQPADRVEGGWEVALPLVVGPRFVPLGVEDGDRITPPVAEGPTGHLVDATFLVDVGRPLATLTSPTHDGDLDVRSGTADFTGLRPTRDLVLRWTLDVDEPVATALRQDDHLLLSFEPPEAPARAAVVPRELVWVIDTSGSQQGEPLDMAKAAMHQALDGMDARDSFALLQFADDMNLWRPAAVPATPGNVAAAHAWIDGLTADGGTQMITGVYGALGLPEDPARTRYVAFLTDGYIGNEQEVLGAIEDLRGDAKVFAFGLGSSVNRYLVREMGRVGQGQSTVVTLDESPEDAVKRFLDTISQPVLTDVTIDWGTYEVDDVDPLYLPDLFAGAPLDVVARVGEGSGPITVRGRMGDAWVERTIDVQRVEREHARAIASTWARRRIAALEREQHWGEIPEVKQEIIDISLGYDVMSQYTSFVAVAHEIIRDGELHRVDQPSEIPDGVNYETSVSRPYTPPGDPLLTVDAPRDAQVLVAYPWGESAVLRWDDLRERWYHRFLVPRDVEDGDIEVVIFVLCSDGTIERRVETLHVDGDAPELEGEVHVLDGRTRVVIYAEEPLRSIEIYPVGYPELAVRHNLGLFDDTEHALEIAGEHVAIEVVAKDRAMNTVVTVLR